MARRKKGEENIRKLNKTSGKSGSYYVTLPVGVVSDLGWKDTQKLGLEKKGSTVVIKDWKK